MLKLERKQTLPPSAWVARIRNKEIVALCGEAVENTATSLVEGVWDGDFTNNDFDKVNHLFGSGLRVDDRCVRIVAPAHTLEGIYVLESCCDFVVSNSLPLLLAYTNLVLPLQRGYSAKIATVVNGVRTYTTTLASFNGHSLHRFVYRDIIIRDRQLHLEHKRALDPFCGYDDYVDRLRGVLKQLLVNAASPKRRWPLTAVTTCSSGYDSAACAAIGAQVGVKRAVTLTTSNRGDCDSGADVARALGLAVVEEKRPDNLNNEDVEEVKFLCAGFGGEDFSFSALAEHCRSALLLVGFHGGKIWDLHLPPDNVMKRRDVSGCSLTEWRLEIGAVLVPVPMIGSVNDADLYRIARSGELRQYSIGGDYDKPVARKIVEDAGVPRHLFGMKKRSTSRRFFRSLSNLSAESQEDFGRFRRNRLKWSQRVVWLIWERWHDARVLLRLGLDRLSQHAVTRYFGIHKAMAVCAKLVIRDLEVFVHGSPVKGDMLFLWSLEKMRERYLERLGASQDASSSPASAD